MPTGAPDPSAHPGGTRCRYCAELYAVWPGPHCPRCGGPLPRPPLPPPAPPRSLSLPYLWSAGVVYCAAARKLGPYVIAGLITWIPGLLVLVALVPWIRGIWILTALFALAGLGCWAFGVVFYWEEIAAAWRPLRALRRGAATMGSIVSVTAERSRYIRGRPPYRIRYSFAADGAEREGFIDAWDIAPGDYQPGQAVWVVYLPEDTSVSAIWPPLR